MSTEPFISVGDYVGQHYGYSFAPAQYWQSEAMTLPPLWAAAEIYAHYQTKEMTLKVLVYENDEELDKFPGG